MDKQKRKIFLLVLVLIVVGGWLGQMPVRGMLRYLKDLDKEIALRRTQHHQDTQEIQDNTQFVTNWNYIEEFLKETQGQSRLDTYLQRLQSESGIQITNFGSFSVKYVEDHPEFLILGYDNLNFSCDLNGLVEFLARVEAEEQRLLGITRISIEATPTSITAGPPASSAATRFESDLPGTVPADLKVIMAISIPAAAPPVETHEGREDRR